jgi:RNA polymerase sigma-70 factor (ECF subfamily)
MVNDTTDQQLLEAMGRRDVGALEKLYDRYGSFAYGLAVRVIGDRQLAEDVIQEVFFNLWRQAGTFDNARGSVRNWLLTSVHHRAIDFVRQRNGKTRRDVELTEAEYRLNSPEPWAEVANSTDRDMLKKGIVALPAEQRRTLEMAYFQGMTHAEIAEATGVPLGTVKGRLRLALEKMRAYLESKGVRTAE